MPQKAEYDMPDIVEYPWQQRRDYLLLVAAVAASDGSMHPDELSLLNQWMDSFKLPRKSRETVLAVANQAPLKLKELKHRLAKSDLIYSLMLDMMGMAMADGVLMDDEIELLRDVADNISIDPIDFDILIEFVHSAHQASMLSNPEPLFEHSIDSAFHLLRQKKVRLFPHTLLCATSPDYDKKLKERWVKFNSQ